MKQQRLCTNISSVCLLRRHTISAIQQRESWVLYKEPELIAKVQELVSIGTVEPVEVQRLLKHHVDHYMCAGNLPDPYDRAYYPCLDDVKNHIAKAKRALQLSVVDQENAVKLIAKQQEASPDSKNYFRPYTNARIQLSQI